MHLEEIRKVYQENLCKACNFIGFFRLHMKRLKKLHFRRYMVTLSFGKTTFFRLYDVSLRSASLDGFEPSTFRLTAEHANRSRHRDSSLATCTHMSISILKSLSESKRLDHAENITDYWSCSVNRLIFLKFYIRLQSNEDKISIILSRIFFLLK